MLLTIATYLAPIATMIAAMMTAANLGARVTGWGFVVFAIGAIGWIVQALATHQTNLLLSNAFLLAVDLVGVWRWLGRQRRYDDGAEAAGAASARAPAPTLFPIGSLAGRPVHAGGARIGAAVEAMASCDGGRIAYLVVSRGGVGGVGETLHAVTWDEVTVGDAAIELSIAPDTLAARPALDRGRWPASAAAANVG